MRRVVGGFLLWSSLVSCASSTAAAAPPSCFGRPATIVSKKDHVSGTPRSDVIVALRGVERVSGLAGADRICLRSNVTDADGGGGRDRIASPFDYDGGIGKVAGGPGDDVLTGEFAHLRGGPGDDVLTGESLAGNGGDDVLRAGRSSATVHYRSAPRAIVADLGEGTVRGNGRDRLEGDIFQFFASPHDDVLVAGNDSAWLVGGLGSDHLTGGPTLDHLYGDFLRPHPKRGGDDVIRGGPALDVIHGGPADDVIHGEGGGDYVSGDVGDDVVHGGVGRDQLSGGKDDDRLKGGAGVDWVVFPHTYADIEIDLGAGTARGLGADRLDGIENANGGDGDNAIYGDEGPNVLYGGEWDDQLYGRDGDDVLWGVSGSDTYDGGAGYDMCYTDQEGGPDKTVACEETPDGGTP